MNNIDPRHYILPKSDIFAEEYFPRTVVLSLIDLLPTDDKITTDDIGTDSGTDDKITINIIDREIMGISSCRHCRHYAHEGRRGGQCEQLNVSVQGSWNACGLSQAVFLEDITIPSTPVTANSPDYCGTELNGCVTDSCETGSYETDFCSTRVAVSAN